MCDNEEKFNEVFRKYQPLIKQIAKRYSRTSRVPEEEFISGLNAEVWDAYKKYDVGKGTTLDTWMNTTLRSRAIKVATRKEARFHQSIEQLPVSNTEETIHLELEDVAALTPEQEFLRRNYTKKEADQRQLIDFLARDPRQVDHDTTLIVSQFSEYDSITALAKALGMHHEFVKRKLRKLSRRYDANRFGDINEYLAV